MTTTELPPEKPADESPEEPEGSTTSTEASPEEEPQTKRRFRDAVVDAGPRTSDKIMTKVGIAIVAALAVTALVISFMSGGGTPADRGGTPGPTQVAPAASSTPIKVTIPTINASSSLVPLGQEKDGSMSVPPLSQPMQAGWYDKSPTPGAIGPAVLAGHVNGGGKPGIFYRLDQVKAGQEVFVDRQDGQTAVFRVDRVDTVPKDNFPTQQVYGDVPNSQIRLITCGGDLDAAAHHYKSNVVVYGTLERMQKT